jgi:hypothetical protein
MPSDLEERQPSKVNVFCNRGSCIKKQVIFVQDHDRMSPSIGAWETHR